MNITVPTEALVQFIYILARLGSLVTFVPFWSNGAVNRRTRALLAVMITLVAFPLVAPAITVTSFDLGTIVKNLLGELMIGFGIGLIVRFVFAGVEMAGHLIGFQVGISVVNAIDPQSQVRTPVLSSFLTFFASIVFLSINAHHWCLWAVIESYQRVPVGQVVATAAATQLLVTLAGQIFAIGLQLSAAVIVVLVVIDIALGILSRAAPRIELLVISFPIKTLAGVTMLGLVLYFFPAAVENHLLKMQANLLKLVSLLHG